MNDTRNQQHVSQILEDLADTIDVSQSKYEEAKRHYKAVGEWLRDENSELAPFKPQIYAQGSFALGTAVRPLGDDEYDVDAVCLLDMTPDQVTQLQLKEMVGQRLKHPKSRYKNMIEPEEGGRRCWTIQYADGSKFHLDVLPCIPDRSRWFLGLNLEDDIVEHSIRLTDKHTPEYSIGWPADGQSSHDPTRSNPKGYCMWFKGRMRVRLNEAKTALAMATRASIEDIEDYQVRTPLQRAIQILKRQRDVRYNGDDDKPISIIISTLAAKAYNNESDLYEAMINIVRGMREHIEKRNGVWWVQNPVNPLENFADKWQECPRKADIFFEWLTALEAEFQNIVTDEGLRKVGMYLAESYGRRDAESTMAKYASRQVGEDGANPNMPVTLIPKRSGNSDKPSYPKIELSKSAPPPWKV